MQGSTFVHDYPPYLLLIKGMAGTEISLSRATSRDVFQYLIDARLMYFGSGQHKNKVQWRMSKKCILTLLSHNFRKVPINDSRILKQTCLESFDFTQDASKDAERCRSTKPRDVFWCHSEER
jgi:hypothetical protein